VKQTALTRFDLGLFDLGPKTATAGIETWRSISSFRGALATKQSSLPPEMLDCFAALAMTGGGVDLAQC